MRATPLAVVALLAAAACTESAPSALEPASPAFAKPATQQAIAATFTIPAAGQNLTSVGGDSYTQGVCGVLARVFYLAPDYLDGNMQLDNPSSKDRSCGSSPRKLTITYPDNGVVQSNSGDMNVALMGGVTVASGPQERSMSISIAGSTARCTRLGFGSPALGGTKVMVTRVNATTWNVASQAGNSTICLRPDGSTVPFSNFSLNFNVSLN